MFTVPEKLLSVLNPEFGFVDGSFWKKDEEERKSTCKQVNTISKSLTKELQKDVETLLQAITNHEKAKLFVRRPVVFLCDTEYVARYTEGILISCDREDSHWVDVLVDGHEISVNPIWFDQVQGDALFDVFVLTEREYQVVSELSKKFFDYKDGSTYSCLLTAKNMGLLEPFFAHIIRLDPEKTGIILKKYIPKSVTSNEKYFSAYITATIHEYRECRKELDLCKQDAPDSHGV
jgi:hypothetical protein